MLTPHRVNSSDLEQARELSKRLVEPADDAEPAVADAGYVDLAGLAMPVAERDQTAVGENVAAEFPPDPEPATAAPRQADAPGPAEAEVTAPIAEVDPTATESTEPTFEPESLAGHGASAASFDPNGPTPEEVEALRVEPPDAPSSADADPLGDGLAPEQHLDDFESVEQSEALDFEGDLASEVGDAAGLDADSSLADAGPFELDEIAESEDADLDSLFDHILDIDSQS